MTLLLAGMPFALATPAWPLLLFAAVAYLGERQSIRVSASVEFSVSFLPLLFVAVVFGPTSAALVGALAVLANFEAPHLRWLVWTMQRVLTCTVAGLAALVGTTIVEHPVAGVLAATALAAIAHFSLDFVLTSITVALRGTGSFRDTIRTAGPLGAAGIPLYTAVAGLLAYSYLYFSPWSAVLFFVPAFAAQRLFVLYQEQRTLAGELVASNGRLERANLSFATGLVATLDARDRYTAGHAEGVAIYARQIAERLGLSQELQQQAHLAGLVHDIGKVGLPAGLLEKPGPLTLAERRQMEQHSVIGEKILARVDGYAEISKCVRHHHERVDGYGYPDGLVGDEIPLLAKIIAVADAYDAMTSDRPYRDAMSSAIARMRLAQAVESQFDTAVVAAFEAILASSQRLDRTTAATESRSIVAAATLS